jgi:hypothetical protein
MRLAKEAMNRVEFLALWDACRLEQDYTNRLLTSENSTETDRAGAARLDGHTDWLVW